MRGFEILEGLRQGQPSTPTRKQKVPYSAEELELLELYFDSNIELGDVPSAEECKEF